MATKLKIALQKSGRLSEDSLRLLTNCGIGFSNGPGKLRSEANNFPLEIFFLRDDDIPQYVEDRVADIGIVGENVVAETSCDIQIVKQLGFGRCRLTLAVPKSFDYNGLSDLEGKRIATAYPKVLGEFFRKNSLKADVHTISGSVEIAPSIGLADAVCDLVSSGSTLFTNGLKEVETVLNSEAVLVSRLNLEENLQQILDKLIFRLNAVNSAKQNKYILLNAPNAKLDEITALLPGIKSPTVMPLAESDWSSVHSVIKENDFWDVVEGLKKKGAEGILLLSIDQMVQ